MISFTANCLFCLVFLIYCSFVYCYIFTVHLFTCAFVYCFLFTVLLFTVSYLLFLIYCSFVYTCICLPLFVYWFFVYCSFVYCLRCLLFVCWQELNDRFAMYIDRVRYLEQQNIKLRDEVLGYRKKLESLSQSVRVWNLVKPHSVTMATQVVSSRPNRSVWLLQ